MPGKNDKSGGYTKSAQRTKFIRKRDIKQKDSELRKEAHISRAMCEGVCNRCREKVQWRFKYDRYKPLTKPGTCQQCRRKTITKAYRTLCDVCADAKRQCASCCVDILEANRIYDEKHTGKNDEMNDEVDGEMNDEMYEDERDEADITVQKNEPQISMGSVFHMDVEANAAANTVSASEISSSRENLHDKNEIDGTGGNEGQGSYKAEDGDVFTERNDEIEQEVGNDGNATGLEESAIRVADVLWNEKKFMNVAANKYSKSREVGNEG